MEQWVQNILTILGTVVLGGGLVVGMGIWLFKQFGERWISNIFAKRLEVFRHDQAVELESLKAQMKIRDDELKALRDFSLSQLGTRTIAIENRKIEAAERLWAAVVEYGRFKMASKMTTSIKMDEMLKRASVQDDQGDKIRAFAAMLWKTCGLDKLPPMSSPDKERPFLTPLTWAKFTAYRSALTLPAAQIPSIMNGVEPKLMADTKPLVEAVKSAFPNWATFIEEHGTSAFPFIVDDMEEEILREIVADIQGRSSEPRHIEAAQKILADVAKFSASAKPKPTTLPPGLT